MKRVYSLFLICLLAATVSGHGQQDVAYGGSILFDKATVSRQLDELQIKTAIRTDQLKVGTNQLIILTPVLRSLDERKELRFEPVAISGGTRYRAINRAEKLGYGSPIPKNATLYKKSNNMRPIAQTFKIPFEEWMRDANFFYHEVVTGCADCDLGERDLPTTLRMVSTPTYKATYQAEYITPDVEAVKQRSEQHDAYLNYVVARYEVLPNFMSNAQELDKVDRVMREVMSNRDLTITNLSVVGYASPEGEYGSNMELSRNRAYSFTNYISQRYGLNSSMFRTEWRGEDWSGLRHLVSQSYLPERSQVLSIIDNIQDISRRKSEIRNLNGGRTYQLMLNTMYPRLRRNTYTIAFIARSFNVDEAKQQIRTNPNLLSLNEMYLVANTYPKNSEQYKEVFDIALRVFPNDPVARTNAAAAALEKGQTTMVIQNLTGINRPEALNNLGVAYAIQGEFDRAADCFTRAQRAGSEAARANAQQLQQVVRNRKDRGQ